MGECNTSRERTGEVYAEEEKEKTDEEEALVRSYGTGRDMGSMAAGGVN